MVKIGDKINAWTVIDGPFREGKRTYYTCQCQCGTIKKVRSDNLKSGHSNSCGCLTKKITECDWKYKTEEHHEIKFRNDLRGTVFGKLYVLEIDHSNKFGETYYKCICECGEEKIVRGKSLVAKEVAWCCDKCKERASIGEELIQYYLKNNNINFEPEYTPPKLLEQYGRRLRFDFYLPERNIYIEFQGRQHYEPIDFFGGEETFQSQKKRDLIKFEFCAKNADLFLTIPYWKIKDIENILDSVLKEEI